MLPQGRLAPATPTFTPWPVRRTSVRATPVQAIVTRGSDSPFDPGGEKALRANRPPRRVGYEDRKSVDFEVCRTGAVLYSITTLCSGHGKGHVVPRFLRHPQCTGRAECSSVCLLSRRLAREGPAGVDTPR